MSTQTVIEEPIGDIATPAAQAFGLIDEGLSTLKHREIVSASEVADLLLDLRLVLVAWQDTETEAVPIPN